MDDSYVMNGKSLDIAPTMDTRQPTLDEAFAYCAGIARAHYENFPVASLFLPAEKRQYIQAVYAFSRIADDFADESTKSATERLALLQVWEQRLDECTNGPSDHPVFLALGETVRTLDLPIQLFRDLLSAFRSDVTVSRYASFADLLRYCACSANPVGRLVLMIFGYRDEQLLTQSDSICTALQLANFWQDLSIDARKDRLYLPLEDIENFGYSVEEWENSVVNEPFRLLLRHEIEETRKLFYEGAGLPALVDRDLQLELKLVWFGGMAVLRRIERVGFDVFRRRPALGVRDKAGILVRALWYNDCSRYGIKRKPWDLT